MKTVPLYGKKAAGRTALVDDADYALVMRYRWNVREKFSASGSVVDGPYAQAHSRRESGQRSVIQMHVLIMGMQGVDHVNHNGLDNQRSNLRPASAAQNMYNRRPPRACSSQYKGVGWSKQRNKWQSTIRIDGRKKYLGFFDSEEEAARIYDAAALEAFGEYAYLNFPEIKGELI